MPAQAGTYSREHHRSQHAEGQCKTTTKTWRQYEDARLMAEFRVADASLYTDAGYALRPSDGIERADVITGHGLHRPGRRRQAAIACSATASGSTATASSISEYPRPHFPTSRVRYWTRRSWT